MGEMKFCLASKLLPLRILFHAKTMHVCLTKYREKHFADKRSFL